MNVVVVGGGLAGASAVAELRDQGYDGDLTLVAAESHLPYERPPLSKSVLLGEAPPDSTVLHDSDWYAELDVELRLGEPVRSLDPAAGKVVTDRGAMSCDRLLLATGSSARPLPPGLLEEGRESVPVSTLRTLDDARRLEVELRPGRRLAIIGGGWIGLEVAAAARTRGAEVVLVEALELPLVRILGPAVASHFAELHRHHGVDLRLSATVTSVGADAAGRGIVRLAGGSEVTADRILVGVGAVPNVALAEEAGLATDDGVLVDARLQTADPRLFVAGDVARAEHPLLGRSIRVEHWDNAIEQGRHAARSMLGAGQPFTRLPYFFTDQYDLGMEYVGHVPRGHVTSAVVRGEPDSGSFTAFWVDGATVLAGMQVNDWDATDVIRRLVGRTVDVRSLADASVPLADLE